MTVQEALDELRQSLKDTATKVSRRRRSDAVFVTLLNISQNNWTKKTRALHKEGNLTVSQSSDTASVPSDFLTIDDSDLIGQEGIISMNNQALTYRTAGWLDKYSQGWRGASSAIPDSWHFKDLDTFRFNVPLNATAAAYTFLIRYIRSPTALSTGSLGTSLLEGIKSIADYHDDIVTWVKARCKRQDGLKDEASTLDAIWRNGFEEAKKELKRMSNQRGQFRADRRWTSQWIRHFE